MSKQGSLRGRAPLLPPLSPQGTIGLLLQPQWNFCIEQIPPLVSQHSSPDTGQVGEVSQVLPGPRFLALAPQRAVSQEESQDSGEGACPDLHLISSLFLPCITPSSKSRE